MDSTTHRNYAAGAWRWGLAGKYLCFLPQALALPIFRDDFDERKTIAMRCVALRNPSVVMETRHNAMNRPIYSPFVVSATDRCNLLQGRLDRVFTQSVQQVAITVVQCIYYATTTGWVATTVASTLSSGIIFLVALIGRHEYLTVTCAHRSCSAVCRALANICATRLHDL